LNGNAAWSTPTAAQVGALASNHAASGVTTTKISNWDTAYTHSQSTHYAEPGIFSGGGTPTLATGVTGEEIRTLIGAGTSSTTGTVTSIAAGNGMNFTTFSTTGTITMGTPSALSASTNSATTSSSHTHAITTTDSGSASTIVKTGSDGSVTAANTFKFGTNASMVYNSTSKTIDFVFA
jgi:hypothetical protein